LKKYGKEMKEEKVIKTFNRPTNLVRRISIKEIKKDCFKRSNIHKD